MSITFSVELQLAAAAPALANGALLFADGNMQKYVDAIKVLYLANSLPFPNLTPLVDMVSATPPATPVEDSRNTPSVAGIFEFEVNTKLESMEPLLKSEVSDFSANEEASADQGDDVFGVSHVSEPSVNQVEQESWEPLNRFSDLNQVPVLPLNEDQNEEWLNQFPVMPVKEEQEEEWLPLSRLSEISSTPLLNKIGISNPSPSAYHYLDLMMRNKKLLFDDCTLSPEAPSFLTDNDRVSFGNDIWGEGFSTLRRQSILTPVRKNKHNTPMSIIRRLQSMRVNQKDIPETPSHPFVRPGLKRLLDGGKVVKRLKRDAANIHNMGEAETRPSVFGKRTRKEKPVDFPIWRS